MPLSSTCSFPISNGVKQGCVLASTLFSIFFIIMLHEATEDLPDGIYARNHRELITDLPFADDCVHLAHTEETLQHIVNRFSDAANNFGLTISLKKTEVLYQPLHVWHTVLLTSASMAPT